ncbi:hypothetical protein HI914_04449 [Erysiphe necator]|nr:hypothetical protein HI914_04449 [Erysiphe necator]
MRTLDYMVLWKSLSPQPLNLFVLLFPDSLVRDFNFRFGSYFFRADQVKALGGHFYAPENLKSIRQFW